VDEPRTHYQISLTARQAVGLFVGLLVALGLAFFFGLMTGLSGRKPAPDSIAAAAPLEPTPDSSAGIPPIETAVPTAVFSPGSRTELAAPATTPVPGEAAAPSTIQPFEDASADEPSPVAAASGGKPPAPPPAAKPVSGEGSFYVQVASLSSKDEAGALSGRLSKHGFHCLVLTAAGPGGKGRVYRVRVGPYRSEPEATRAAEKLSRQEKIKGPWVVPEGK
jgi:cell division septation protein DedD